MLRGLTSVQSIPAPSLPHQINLPVVGQVLFPKKDRVGFIDGLRMETSHALCMISHEGRLSISTFSLVVL